MVDPTQIVGHYEIYNDIDRQLGKGQFGKVVVGMDTRNQRKVAVKIQTKAKINSHQKYREFYDRELNILRQLNSEYIVQLYDVEEDNINCYFFTELCQSTLGGYINQLNTLDSKYNIIIDIIRGFQILFEQSIIHRDIKLDNILIRDGRAKIGDFGFAKTLIGDPNEPQQGTAMSTAQYCAPELLKRVNAEDFNVDEVTAKCDVFSLGVLIFFLIFEKFPWGYFSHNYEKFKSDIQNNPLVIPNDPVIDENLRILLTQMLQSDLNTRISWDLVFKSDFVKPRI